MNIVDIIFPVSGEPVPVDHGYPLYAALSRRLSWLHDEDNSGGHEGAAVGVLGLTGRSVGDSRLALDARSKLRLRLPAERLSEAVGLTAATLKVSGAQVRLGPPSVRPLVPATSLWSPLVLIKVAGRQGGDRVEPESFVAAADRQLAALGIDAELSLPVRTAGERAGEPRRKVLRVKGATHAGYPVLVTGLSSDGSLKLQAHGLGGRRRMGCGLFLPARRDQGGAA